MDRKFYDNLTKNIENKVILNIIDNIFIYKIADNILAYGHISILQKNEII